ncbi:MAG TPA: hypothetical protein VK456_02435 [Xanthobacteraceae bacterium]|nr:hypothetical protein [Xanthobacteraceae bacterium]
MSSKTIAATALAIFLATTAAVLGSASTALAQYASPGPTYDTQYAYGPNGYDTWSTNQRALHQHRGVGDTNGW